MANHIKRVKTTSGNAQIDYAALANLPSSDMTLSIEGAFADALTTGSEIDYLENIKADYILKSIDGSFIYLNDSANAKMQRMRVMGKSTKTASGFSNVSPLAESLGGNLLPYPYRTNSTQNNVTFYDNGDGSITLVGKASSEIVFPLYSGNTITGARYLSGCNSDGSIALVASDNTTSGNISNTSGYTSIASLNVKQIYINIKSGATVNTTIYPMVSYDEIDYEPYKRLVAWKYDGELLGVPVTENGNYIDDSGQMWVCDEIDCNFSHAKHIQRIGIIDSYTGQSIRTPYLSSGNGLETGATIYYVLETPIEKDVVLETTILRTYCPTTTIRSNTYLDIIYATDLKNYIDNIAANVIVEESDPTVPAWAKEATKPSYTKSEVGLGNLDDVRQYSTSNPPPYPVTSVNGQTGAVTIEIPEIPEIPDIPDSTNDLINDSGFITKSVSNLDNYYKKTETYNQTEIDNKIKAIPATDLSNYYKKSETYSQTEIDQKGYLTQHQSLSGYAKTTDHYTKTQSDERYQAKGNYLTSVTVDTTMTKTGVSADAKAVGDLITQLNNTISQLNNTITGLTSRIVALENGQTSEADLLGGAS